LSRRLLAELGGGSEGGGVVSEQKGFEVEGEPRDQRWFGQISRGKGAPPQAVGNPALAALARVMKEHGFDVEAESRRTREREEKERKMLRERHEKSRPNASS
jgi:hypothetical protein